MPKISKKKTKSYAQLKKELDRVFSIWVRSRAANADGIAVCVTCWTPAPWPKLQAGHFISRNRLSTRWHERNVFPQCYRCNVALRGNYPAYAAYLVSQFGKEILEQLLSESRQPTKLTRADLSVLIERYSGFKHLPNEDSERYMGIESDQPGGVATKVGLKVANP